MPRGEPSSSTSEAESRGFALALLELPAGAGAEQARQALLARLRDNDHQVEAELAYAYLELAGRPLHPDQAFLLREAGALTIPPALNDRINELVGPFFDHDPPDRRREWNELMRLSAPYRTAQMRLRALEPGLDVDIGRFSSPSLDIRTCVQIILDLFILEEPKKTFARQTRVRELLDDPDHLPSDWRLMVGRLRRKHRKIAALDPRFLVLLADAGKMTEELRPPADPPALITGRKSGTMGVVIGIGFLALLRFLADAGGSGPKASSPPPLLNNFALPKSNAPPVFLPASPRDLEAMKAKLGAVLEELDLETDDEHLTQFARGLPMPEVGIAAFRLMGGTEAARRRAYLPIVHDRAREAGLAISELQIERIYQAIYNPPRQDKLENPVPPAQAPGADEP